MTKLANLKSHLNSNQLTELGLQRIMDQLASISPAGLEYAMTDEGIIDQDTLIDWLKSRIKTNVDQGYFDYVPIEAHELQVVSDSDDIWWTLNAYERVERLSAVDVEVVIDDIA